MSKIKISEQHGLNPTINVCFFCGKDKEVMLLGKLKGDAKAPKRIIANYLPCKDCADKMSKGRVLIEVTDVDNNMPEIKQGFWPTGRWCVVSKETATQLFKDDTNKPTLVEDKVYQMIFDKKG